MKLTDYPLLTDENIDSVVTSFLRAAGFDVLNVIEEGLQGSVCIAETANSTNTQHQTPPLQMKTAPGLAIGGCCSL